MAVSQTGEGIMLDDDKELPAPDDKELPADEGEAESPPEEETPPDDAEGEEEADDAVDEEGDEGEGEDEGQPRGRATSRVSKLANERKEALARASKAENDVAELRRQMAEVQGRINHGQTQADLQAEQELLANMDPIQRVQYEADKKIDGLKAQIRNVQLASLDNTDRATFLAKASTDPIRAKYAPKVETALAEMRAKGINAPREDIYFYMLGKSFAEQKAKGGKVADKKAAQSRVEAVRGRTSSVRSDASSGRSKGKTAEQRLEGVPL